MRSILTTVVGSYPVPDWLRVYPSRPNLRDAVLTVLKTQELAGLDVITDGEISRFSVDHPETNGMIETFVRPLSGVRTVLTRSELEEFAARSDMQFRSHPAGVVYSDVGEGTMNLLESWEFVKNLSEKPLKFTVTSPYMLAKTLLDQRYADIRELAWALAEVLRRQVEGIDAPYVQIDEANLPGNPGDAMWAHEVVNRVLEGVRGDRGMHLCFGNYGGQAIQRGVWKDMIAFINNVQVSHVVLEFARRGYEELPLFRELRGDIELGVGVIDIKDNEIETPETVARRIERAAEILGADRVRWVHPDCGFWMLPRTVADGKMHALVAGRDLFIGAKPKR